MRKSTPLPQHPWLFCVWSGSNFWLTLCHRKGVCCWVTAHRHSTLKTQVRPEQMYRNQTLGPWVTCHTDTMATVLWARHRTVLLRSPFKCPVSVLPWLCTWLSSARIPWWLRHKSRFPEMKRRACSQVRVEIWLGSTSFCVQHSLMCQILHLSNALCKFPLLSYPSTGLLLSLCMSCFISFVNLQNKSQTLWGNFSVILPWLRY